jgi:hypothetical protein
MAFKPPTNYDYPYEKNFLTEEQARERAEARIANQEADCYTLLYQYETKEAYLFSQPQSPTQTFWVPKSQLPKDIEIGIDKDNPDNIRIWIPRWLAKAKGLI